MKSIEPLLFLQLIKSKNRQVVYTLHALHRAEQRFLNSVIAENDLLNQTPVKVLEQE